MARGSSKSLFHSGLKSVLNEQKHIESLKPQQLTALEAFLSKEDVLALLPTDFGKSLIYQLAKLVSKKMSYKNHVVAVVSMVALMEQQVSEASKLGVTAMQIGVSSTDDIFNGKAELLFRNPEAWLLNEKWRSLLSNLKELVDIVVDEVHLTYKWGLAEIGQSAFRECFARLGELRSIVKTGLMEAGRKYTVGIVLCIVLALTYLLVVSNVEQSQGQFYLPPYKKPPPPPEPEWEDPGPYHIAYPRNYRFIMDDTGVCRDSNPFILLVVHVAPFNVTARNIIRSSWGQRVEVRGQLVQTLFFLGVQTGAGSESLQEQLSQENQQHHDIIQSNFMDSYHNLTIKTMMMLEWLSLYCSTKATFVVKADSDMFLHISNLVNLLLRPDTPKNNYMTGLVWWHSPVIRDPNNRFYLPPEVIAEDTYPPYPLGMTYILSLDLPRKILEASQQIKPIYIEDAYLGMCLRRLNLSPTEPPESDMFLVDAQHPLSPCALSRVIATTITSIPQMMSYWRRSQQPETHC